MKAARESDLVAAVLQYLKLRGVFAWRNNSTGIRRTDRSGRQFWAFSGLRGVSDVLGVLGDGRILCVECKSETGRLTPEQEYFQSEITRRGGLAIVVRNVQELIDALGDAHAQ